MTNLFEDILRDPSELSKSLAYSLREGRPAVEEAACILKKSAHTYIVGIGSSWNSGLLRLVSHLSIHRRRRGRTYSL
jgi:hypothetical protein